jgi:membrane-associated phospholipid phosphatase
MGFLDLLAKGFLTFGHPTLIIPFLIIGFLLEKNAIIKNSELSFIVWVNACLLILFTMIFNTLLKSLFLVPLHPAIGKEGFAFPSGHMQVSVAFYGWVFWIYANRSIRVLILLILAGVGWGLIQQGYHTLEDVVAAAVVGSLTVYGFVKVSQLPLIQKKPERLSLCLIPVVGLMMGIIHYRIGIPPHIQITFTGLSGIAVGWFSYSRCVMKTNS